MEGIREIAKAYYLRADGTEKQLVRDYFKRLDLNGDGKITLVEFKRSVQLSEYNIFNQLDRNGDGKLDFQEAIPVYYIVNHMKLHSCDECHVLLVGPYFSCTICRGKFPSYSYDLCCACHGGGQFEHEHSTKYILDHHGLLSVLSQVVADAGRKEVKQEEDWRLKQEEAERELQTVRVKQENHHRLKQEELERELESAKIKLEEHRLKQDQIERDLYFSRLKQEEHRIKQEEVEREFHSAKIEQKEHQLKHEEEVEKHQLTITALKTEVEALRSGAKVNNEVQYGDWLMKIIISGFIGLILQFFIMKMMSFIWSFTILVTMLGIKMINKLVSESAEDWVLKILISICTCLIPKLFRDHKENIYEQTSDSPNI